MDNHDPSLKFPPLASLAAAANQHQAGAGGGLAHLPHLAAVPQGGQPFASMGAIASTSAQPYGAGEGGAEVGGGNAAGGKKPAVQKRKSSIGPGGDDGGSDGKQAKKPKIPRACDVCRRKKIRCNPIPDIEPMMCTYCQKHKLECTWFLPISETRFKKQREKEEAEKQSASAAAAAVNLPTAATSVTLARQARGDELPTPPQHRSSLGPTLPLGLGGESHSVSSPDSTSPSAQNQHNPKPREPRVIGYTSITHLMHSTSTFPTERMIPVDHKYSQSLSVDERGDGFIRVISTGDVDSGEPVAIQGIEHSDAEKLLNYYFTTHSFAFPIVSRADFLGQERPQPLLFNTLCAVSALSHHVAPSILRTIKSTIRSQLREQDMLDNSSLSNIQALLIYAYSAEMESQSAGSKTWNALRLAISMAQDLGLHRKLGTERKEQNEADHVELRRRVWGGCLIADRWMSAIYGQPCCIDLADCDTMLPSVFDIRPNSQGVDTEHRPYLFNSALISLSILLGRILKAVYSPTGIMLLSEKDAKGLVNDLASWQNGLPEELRFQDADTSTPEQGFLHLLYIPVKFLITRPFMRLSFQLPERFASVSVGTQQWSFVEAEARKAIEWVDKHESCLEGWFAGTYAFFIAALIQYHSHIRRRDTASLSTLRLARDCLKRLVVPEGECHVRAKIAEVVHLLYHTAVSVTRWAPEAAEGLSPASSGTTAVTTLNPTAGVRQREQDWHMRFKKDGGYFVTDRRLHDPTGLIRSSASPVSANDGPSPRNQQSPNMSSLRSTHLAEEAEDGKTPDGAGRNGETEKEGEESPSLPLIPPQPPTFPLPPPPTASQPPISSLPTTTNGLPIFPASAPNPPPDLSFAFPDSKLENLSFNPVLNFATASGTATPIGNGPSLSNGTFPSTVSAGGGGGASFLGGGENSFDPFGFSMDGTPSMLPDSLFDWSSWSNFASSLGVSGQSPGSGSAASVKEQPGGGMV